MLSILTDTEKAVVQTLTMKMNVKPALQYLEDVGFKMSRATYYRHKSKVEALKFQRLKFIAEHFQEQYLEKIDKLELIENLMWENYNKEANPSKKVKILESIVNAQPYLSSYYESSTIALEVTAKFNGNGNGQANTHVGPMKFDEWISKNTHPRIADDSQYNDEENGTYYWELHKKYNEYVKEWESDVWY